MDSNSVVWIVIAVVAAIVVIALVAFLARSARNKRRHAQAEEMRQEIGQKSRARREARGHRGRNRGEGPGRAGRGRSQGRRSRQAVRAPRAPIASPRPPLVKSWTRIGSAPMLSTPSTTTTRAPRTICVIPKRPTPGRRRPKRRPPGSDTGCDTCRRPPGGAVRRRRHAGRLELSPCPCLVPRLRRSQRRGGSVADPPVDRDGRLHARLITCRGRR